MKNSILSLPIAAVLLGACAITASGQTAVPTTVTFPPSSVAAPGDAGVRSHTNLAYVGPAGKASKSPDLGPPFPGYLFQTPASIACIYELVGPSWSGCNPNVVTANPNGGGRAIAVVDAYDDPNAYMDLENFSTQFGLAPITPSSFQVVYAPFGNPAGAPGSCSTGPGPEPASAAGTGWDLEESLDIEYTHAMAPEATIYLVEAQSSLDTDLFCAVSVASNLVAKAGGGEVNMSFGSGEFPAETSVDSIFTTHSVVYLAAAGDSAGVYYPSASPNVVSVGGTATSMSTKTGKFEGETAWQDAGGGPSAYEPRPSYQNEIAFVVGNQRGTPDISAIAATYTDSWVLDTLVYGPGTWYAVFGTSVAVVVMTGIVNAAHSFEPSSNAELSKMYSSPFGFTDITAGSCGEYAAFFATPGWDFCTGLGSPRGYLGK
jgi:kumamolisin